MPGLDNFDQIKISLRFELKKCNLFFSETLMKSTCKDGNLTLGYSLSWVAIYIKQMKQVM